VVPQQMIALAGAVVILLIFAAFFRFTRIGKVMRATADNPRAATLVGISIENVYTLAFGTGAAIAGAAGVLAAPLTLLYPDMGFAFFIKGFAAAVLGGLTSLSGAIVGGLLVGVVEAMAGGYIDSSMMELSPFIMIMIVLIICPTGLLSLYKERHV
jgi:branched-chain amino acid transport system permease protein